MVRRKPGPRSFSERSKDDRHRKKTNVFVTKNIRKSHILREIKYLRRTTHYLIPKLSFSRVVREIFIDLFPRQEISRIQAAALEALQEAAEMYIVQFFEDSILLALHAKRVTLMQNDMILMRRLRGRDDVINR